MAHNFQLSDPALLVQTGIIDNASGTARSGLTFKVFDPATDVEWATRAAMDAIDTEAAIASAHKAFPAWAATPARTRAKMILKLDALVREHKEDLAQIITMETGKPLAEARGEVDYAGVFIHLFWFWQDCRPKNTWYPGRRMIVLIHSLVLLADGWRGRTYPGRHDQTHRAGQCALLYHSPAYRSSRLALSVSAACIV